MDAKKKRGSIKLPLILTMVLLVVVPLAIAVVVSSLNTISSAKSSSDSLNQVTAQLMEQKINNVMDQNMQVIKALAATPDIVAYVGGSREPDREARILSLISTADANFADNDGNVISIADGTGFQILRTKGNCVDISTREYYTQAMAGGDYASDMIVSKSMGTRICTFSTPVKDENGKVIGIVQRNYDLECFHEILAEALTEEKQEIVMVDRTGSVIAHSGHLIKVEEPEDQSGNQFYTDSRGSKLEGTYETAWQGEKWMISWVKEDRTGWVVASCRVESVAMRQAMATTFVMIGIGILAAVVGVVIAFVMSRSFTDPLKKITETVSALADGRFIKVDKYTDRNDEFGQIVTETNTLIDTLSHIVDDIKKSAVNVNEESVSLADTADQISQTADDVSNAVQEIAHGATQQADEIQAANNNTMVISDNIQQVTDNAEAVATTASEMSENSRDSADKLDQLKASSEHMSKAIDEISEKISATGAAVERISGKVEAINSIASQTNLLALNASIEAARAGEAGRGFAVVAEEIGKLADESSHSADEIRAEMNLLLNESQSAIETAKEVNATTKEQKEILDATVESISKLIEEIESSVEEINSITTSAEACEQSKGVIVDAMTSLSSISEENAASCQETGASMEELNATVNTLASAADKLRHISDSLIKEMRFFK
ncbi:MAG: methyl-accepting chemotaxis protein [Lachnospiraceae bacterium]|nr:methyl-accepting chemotaxis protein [Lachnospiraceae bacterium]